MTSEDKGHYSKKLPPGFKADRDVEKAMKKVIKEGAISCAKAHSIAKKYDISPSEVGQTIDFLEVSICKCQMGLFGYPEGKCVKPAETVPPELEEAIRISLKNDKISCKSAWDIAERLGTGRMKVSAACESLGIKIVSCQLGAFK
ncbi:MAG: hypothetical protein JW882_07795 [Deltaproteobacteria bacterium]|nr:hypothetical protein [Deltaproteobacteria bacterium]